MKLAPICSSVSCSSSVFFFSSQVSDCPKPYFCGYHGKCSVKITTKNEQPCLSSLVVKKTEQKFGCTLVFHMQQSHKKYSLGLLLMRSMLPYMQWAEHQTSLVSWPWTSADMKQELPVQVEVQCLLQWGLFSNSSDTSRRFFGCNLCTSSAWLGEVVGCWEKQVHLCFLKCNL